MACGRLIMASHCTDRRFIGLGPRALIVEVSYLRARLLADRDGCVTGEATTLRALACPTVFGMTDAVMVDCVATWCELGLAEVYEAKGQRVCRFLEHALPDAQHKKEKRGNFPSKDGASCILPADFRRTSGVFPADIPHGFGSGWAGQGSGEGGSEPEPPHAPALEPNPPTPDTPPEKCVDVAPPVPVPPPLPAARPTPTESASPPGRAGIPRGSSGGGEGDSRSPLPRGCTQAELLSQWGPRPANVPAGLWEAVAWVEARLPVPDMMDPGQHLAGLMASYPHADLVAVGTDLRAAVDANLAAGHPAASGYDGVPRMIQAFCRRAEGDAKRAAKFAGPDVSTERRHKDGRVIERGCHTPTGAPKDYIQPPEELARKLAALKAQAKRTLPVPGPEDRP